MGTTVCSCGAEKSDKAAECWGCYNTRRFQKAKERTSQVCTLCQKDKPLTEFAFDRRRPCGRQSSCRQCQGDRNRKTGHPAQRKYRLREVYGLTVAQYDELYATQRGRCAGCRAKIHKHGSGTHIDHDHKTGRVRGLLCKACNSTIGYARDDIQRLKGLIAFLRKAHRGNNR